MAPSLAEQFRALHHADELLLLPNPWDVGSAKLLASLGFKALATTSSGFAASLGQLDGTVGRDQSIAHAKELTEATGLPVSGDFENCWGATAAEVGETIRLAVEAGLAGCSVEDSTGRKDDPIFDLAEAVDRVTAAAEAAHAAPDGFVLTARAENFVHGRNDLADTIVRLQAYEAAGADVLYAPFIVDVADVRSVVESVGLPVNVLARPGLPPIAELSDIGVRRVSVGGGFAFAALGTLVEAASELMNGGTYTYLQRTTAGGAASRKAFAD